MDIPPVPPFYLEAMPPSSAGNGVTEPREDTADPEERDAVAPRRRRYGGLVSFDHSQLLLELGRDVTSTLDLQQVLDRTFVALHRLLDFGGGAIQLIEEDHLVAAATDPPMSPEAKTVRIPVGTGISGTIAVTGEPIYIPDIWVDPRVHPEGRKKGVSSGVRSYFGAPLIQGGQPVGVIQVDSPITDAFDPSQRALVLAFVPTVAAAVQNAQLFARERESLQALEEATRMKRDFLAVVSHELRTPLTSVSGFGHTLANHADALDVETITDIGERIWRASRRLERVMGDLLDLSNIERRALSVAMRPTDLEQLVRDAAREQDDHHHGLEITTGRGLPKVWTDEDRLHQVLGNLLSNARKFSREGSTIHIGIAVVADRVAVSVADEGRGIPPAMHEHVFEPFTQIEPAQTRSTEGLGVGLYLVKQLCERMDIQIEVASQPGTGSVFTLSIPTAGETVTDVP